MQDYFFLIFLITIVAVRWFLYLKPFPSPHILGFRMHHYMLGAVILVGGMIFTNLTIYSIGVGLLADEVPYLIIGGKNHADNYSVKSLLGLLFLILLVYCFRRFLVSWYI